MRLCTHPARAGRAIYIPITRITTLPERIRRFAAPVPFPEVNHMVALSSEIKEIFTKTKVMPMATASKAGIPNVAPMASILLVNDDTVWIMDNYMVKTLENLKENPVVALYFYDQDTKRCFQIKGSTEIKTSGPDYEKFRDQVKTKGHKYPAKSLIVIKITDVFECTPGNEAGKKVL